MNSTKSILLKFIFVFLALLIMLSVNAQLDSSNVDVGVIAKVEKSVEKPKIWDYLIDTITPILAFITFLIARPLLKKKLIENHVTLRIEQIHESNSQVRQYCQKLISRYTPLAYRTAPLGSKDIKNLSQDLGEGYLLTTDSSSEVATLMYCLKNTIGEYERKFASYNKYFLLVTSDILPFVIDVLNRVVQYSTQVIPVPVKTRVRNVDLIAKPLRKYVTDGKMSRFKNFRLGVNYDEDCAMRLIHTDLVNRTSMQYLKECACIVTKSTRSLAKLFLLRKIYAPLIWTNPRLKIDTFFKRSLTLVGFDENKNISMDSNSSTDTVVLFYSNLTRVSHRPRLNENSFLNDFSDGFLNLKDFKFPKPIKFTYVTDEMIKVEVEREALHEVFRSHKRKIRNNLKIKREKIAIVEKVRKKFFHS